MIENKEKKHSHYGHRKRLKEEFLVRGLTGMPEHKILELMLFFALPQGDTNNIAHDLIERFGSLRVVLNASFEQLQEVGGVKEHTATMICFFRALSRIYLTGEYSENILLDNFDALKDYCKTLFINSQNEEIHIIFLDDDLKLVGEKKLCEGTFGAVELPLRNVVESVVNAKCNIAVLAHNHPIGSCMPSKFDLNSTIEIWKLFNTIGIDLVDHMIIGKDGEWSMKYNHTLQQIWRV